MKNVYHTTHLIRAGLFALLLTTLLSVCAQAASNNHQTAQQTTRPTTQQHTQQYAYQFNAKSDWKVTAAHITPRNNTAKFSAKIFHRHKRAVYPRAHVQVRIVDTSGKLLGAATAKPEQIFDAEKAWRKTGVNYKATLDFVPPKGSRVEVMVGPVQQ